MTLRDDIKRDEGLRLIPYKCPRGFWTVGFGHKFDDTVALMLMENCAAPTLTEKQAEELLDMDLREAEEGFAKIFHSVEISDVRRDALTNMIFNLGVDGFKGFRKMIAAVCVGEWERAASEARDSRWFSQVGAGRAGRIVDALWKG
ncbi:MAG TPA: glycoside hydrolase family protein [Acidobacteriota bacterium]|nr:glycoside hydrolase family protein [Acidobacteriota bacterium]